MKTLLHLLSVSDNKPCDLINEHTKGSSSTSDKHCRNDNNGCRW